MNKILALSILLLAVSGCRTAKLKTAEKPTDKVNVLTFNAENLFDLDDDDIKNDDTFLPSEKKSSEAMQNKCRARNSEKRYIEECLFRNYSSTIYNRKLRRMTHVIGQVNDGRGPDILILQEIENRAVVEDWRVRYLAKLGYGPVITEEGPDERGIDTAILTRLPEVSPAKLHLLDYTGSGIAKEDIRDTRGILEARLQLPDGQEMAVFGGIL